MAAKTLKFNAEDYIAELISQPNYLPPDLFLDDRDIPEAKNVIEFLHSERFIGNMLPNKLFPRQAEILIKLNAEYCPKCTDMDYFNNEGVSVSKVPVNESFDKFFDRVTLLEYGVCPKCGARKSELVKEGLLMPKTESALCLGQRSGKSAVTSMQESYTIHKFNKVPNLQRTYNLLPSSPFVIPLVAMTFEKAKILLYNALYEYLTKGNWFKQYHEFLDDQQATLGLKEELYMVKDTFTRYRHKNILIAPFGPDKRKLRGNTSISSALDEVGWMIAGQEGGIKFDADEIYNSINNSLMTAKESYLTLLNQGYDNLPAPINCNISSPSSKKDKICRLLEDSKKDKYMFGMQLATWEVNPSLPFDGPTMTALRMKNEKDFWRDFGAVPPNSSNSFFPDIELLMQIVNGKPNLCKIKKERHLLADKEYIYGKVLMPKAETTKPARILALDAGSCVSEDTLLQTNKGIIPIKFLSENFDNNIQISCGENNTPNIKKIFDNGIKECIKITTDLGHSIEVTKDHLLRVFDNGVKWKQAAELKEEDIILSSYTSLTRKDPLKLNLIRKPYTVPKYSNPSKGIYLNKKGDKFIYNNKRYKTLEEAKFQCSKENPNIEDFTYKTKKIIVPKIPKEMTPDLAYLLGAYVSEGNLNKYSADIANTNLAYIKKLSSCIEKEFGITASIYYNPPCENSTKRNNRKLACYHLNVTNSEYVNLLCQLGLSNRLTVNKIRPARFKEIPWSILQADEKSQLAFIASYIEGDGEISLNHNRIQIWSTSDKLLQQFQILLASHGIVTKIFGKQLPIEQFHNSKRIKARSVACWSTLESLSLYQKIEPFLIFKKKEIKNTGRPMQNSGIPSQYYLDFIKSRRIRFNNQEGTVYRTDDGVELKVSAVQEKIKKGKILTHASYLSGKYNELLEILFLISNEKYVELKTLFDSKSIFNKITKIENVGPKKVFDLAIDSKTHSYKANNIIVHNCNNSFAFAIAHLSGGDKNKKVVFDALVEIIPEDNCSLDFSKIYSEVIEPMIKNYNIKMVCTDRWQNLKILADIANNKALKCKTQQYSVKYSDFVNFRQDVMDKAIEIPKPELKKNEIEYGADNDYPLCFEDKPISHFIFQAITVIDMAGKQVIKGEKLTDDIFRAAILAYSIITREEHKNLFKGSSFGGSFGGGGLGANPTGANTGNGRLGALPTSAFNPFGR